MVNHPNRSLSAAQREALRRLTRKADWCEAYQIDVAGSVLGRLLTKGFVDAKAPNELRATRYKINDDGRSALELLGAKGNTDMAKREYKAKQVSPEIARENAISAAKSNVVYAQHEVGSINDTIAQWASRGISEVDGLTMADLERRAFQAFEGLTRALAELAALEA